MKKFLTAEGAENAEGQRHKETGGQRTEDEGQRTEGGFLTEFVFF